MPETNPALTTGETDPVKIFAALDAAEKSASAQPSASSGPAADAPPSGNATEPAATQPEAVVTAPPAEDIFTGINEKQRAELDKLRTERETFSKEAQEAKSLRGRVPHFQRENAKLKDELAALKAEREKPKETAASAAPAPGDPDWDQFKSDYPDFAKVIEKREAAIDAKHGKRVEELEKRLGKISETTARRESDDQVATLLKNHPDFAEIKDSKEFDAFVDSLPPRIAALRDSPHAEDADYLLRQFKASRGTETPQPSAPASNGAKPQSQPAPNPKRQAQRESAVSPRGSQPATVTQTVPDDPQAAWEYWERKDREAQASRR